MPNQQHTGSVVSSDPRAKAQAQSIGATIGGDGWWYAGPNTPGKKQGERLLPEEADALTQQAGTAITSTDDAHDKLYRDKEGRAIRGDLWKQGDRSRPAAKALGTALVTGGTLAALAPAAAGGAAASTAGTAAGGLGTAVPAAGGIGSTIAGLLPKAIGAIGSLGGPQGLGGIIKDWALPAAGIANAAYLGQKSGNFADLAASNADARWKAKAPLRDMGIAGMLHPAVIDVSALEAQRRNGNPFAVPMPVGG